MDSGLISWSPGITLDSVEEQVIRFAYRFYKNNKTATANALGISIRTLDSKLERYENDDRARAERNQSDKADRLSYLARARGQAERSVISQAPGAEPPRAFAGVYVEPSSDAAREQPVPVSEPKEVQKVLPKPSPASGPRGNR